MACLLTLLDGQTYVAIACAIIWPSIAARALMNYLVHTYKTLYVPTRQGLCYGLVCVFNGVLGARLGGCEQVDGYCKQTTNAKLTK